MKLRLKIQSYANQHFSSKKNTEYTFKEEGGTVGRGSNNSWILDYDNHLSRQHMRIEIIDRKFYIRDLSSNGVFINNSRNSIGKNNIQQISDGDIIKLGEHEMTVEILDDSLSEDIYKKNNLFEENIFSEDGYPHINFNKTEDTHISELSSDDPFGDIFNPSRTQKNNDINLENEEFNNIHNAFSSFSLQSDNSHHFNGDDGELEPKDNTKEIRHKKQENNILITDCLEKYAKQTEPEKKSSLGREENSFPSTPVEKNNENICEDNSLERLLSGAGITFEQIKKDIPQDIYEIIGNILHESIRGIIELLRGRTEIKNHLKLDRTIIGDIENNPLKFMPNPEQVMIYLFTSGNGTDKTYLSLLDAIKEAMDDLKAHQIAISISMHQALLSTLRYHFSPDNLKKKLEKSNKISSKIPLHREARLWGMFESLYSEIEHEASENFQAILDKEIAKAYELQMMEIKYQRNISRKNKTS